MGFATRFSCAKSGDDDGTKLGGFKTGDVEP